MREGGTLIQSEDRSFTFGIRPDPYDAVVQAGCNGACLYIPDTGYKAVLSKICGSLDSISKPDIRSQVSGFCSTLSHGLIGLEPGIDIGVMYSEIQEDEAYFEWIFDNFRLGYSFLSAPSDSYWFLVSKDPDGDTKRFEGDFRAGYLPAVQYSLSYIRSNA